MLLPAPDGPTSATRAPRGTEKDTPRSTSPRRPAGASVLGVRQLDGRGVDVRVLEHGERLGLRLAARRDDGVGVAEVHVAELDRGRRPHPAADGCRASGPEPVEGRRGVVLASRSGRSRISWMRPSAPSAWLTDVIAPKNDPSGAISRNRNMTKVTRLATVIAPEATRKPPTPSTTSSDTCSAMPAIGTMSADTLAIRTPDAVDLGRDAGDRGRLALVGAGRAHGADRADGALDARREFADLLLLLVRGLADPAAEQRHARRSRARSRARSTPAAPGR